MSVLINIDVPDLEGALAFYTQVFGLKMRRRSPVAAEVDLGCIPQHKPADGPQ